MDQQELRRLENQCIQENLPECTAACPLHIDVRAFVSHITHGNWAESLKVLRKTMPLPNILGRICDAPCEDRCKRREVDEAIRIGALERVCVRQKAAPQRTPLLPPKRKRIAVVGSGLSSLTAAWDSIRKGYGVRIFEPGEVLGGPLRNQYPEILPWKVIEEETALLIELGLEVELEARVDEPDFQERCLEIFEAVYLGLDALSGVPWKLGTGLNDRIQVEAKIQRTSQEGVFAGGLPYHDRVSPVWQAAQGRWAANYIDRFLQKVSLTAGREKEGPVSTRLFTSLADVLPEPAVKSADPILGYTNDEAIQEAQRCLQCQCLECVKVCVYLERFGAYPKKYAREIYNNESIVIGSRQANKLINSCSLCGLCETVCPEDFAMQDLCLQSRQGMVQRGKMPPSAHEFALLDMAFNQSERFALARHEPGRSASAQAFFPGCQLSGSAPDKVLAVYEHLRSSLSGGVGLILGCCAAPAYWAGRQEQFADELKNLKAQWCGLGEPRLILACSTCLRIFKDHMTEIPVVSLWQVLEKTWDPVPFPGDLREALAIHDPCTTRSEPEIQSSVRQLLSRLGVLVEELKLSREKTECCGFGGLLQNANPGLAREVVQRRAQRSGRDYLTYCAMCRDSLASANKRSLHLLDLLFSDPQIPDPAARERPGWSQRQENRSRLKDHLLKELWAEEPTEMKDHQKIKLQIAPQVRVLLEERRILDEDLQKVIHHAEISGEKFYDPETGRFKAAFRPYKATFWVEYGPSNEGFVVFNAYFHRMELAVS
jgi:NADPH-dependent glutamate synthase beta subunit-like oxidoreductase